MVALASHQLKRGECRARCRRDTPSEEDITMKTSSSNIASKMICLVALFATAVLIGGDLPAAAQNTNSGSTSDDSMMMQRNSNSNMGRRRTSTRRRGARRRNMNNANTGDATTMSGDANMSGDTSGNMNGNMSGDASMQNMNGNMSGDASMQNMNGNMSGDTTGQNMNMGRRGRRGRRGNRRTSMSGDANANMTTDMSGDTSGQNMNANMSGSMAGGTQTGSMPGMGTFGDVADLSGTYTGTINYPEGGMTGDATMTITANTFTLTGGAATQSGTLSARSWPGYTALSMRFGDTLPATIVSTRAWHRGNSLRIQSVRGETRAFSFNGRGEGAAMGATTGSGTRRRSRGRRGRGRRGRTGTMMTPTTTDAEPTPTPSQ